MKENWTSIITPNSGLFNFNIKEVWLYRDLLWMFVKRDIITVYKQTILGPLWYVIQPIMTTLMFTVVFGRMASLSTDGTPDIIFYLLGVTIWGYFSECLNKTSNTFVANQRIFGKVYFPRVLVPASLVISSLGKLIIQMILFLAFWSYYFFLDQISANWYVLLLPFIIMILGITSLGFGMIFSSLTTKYRDLSFLLTFGIQLWMYGTPVIYPLSSVPSEYRFLIELNPLTFPIEACRYAFLGSGYFSWEKIIYSSLFGITIFCIGFLTFSKVEKNFMDTV